MLFAHSNKVETANGNASSYKNDIAISSSETEKTQSVDDAETSESESTASSSASYSNDIKVVTDSEVLENHAENKQVAYSKGDFAELHETLIQKYSTGYQSFSKEALIDLYGVGCDEENLEDAIGFIAQNSFNQLFVFKNCSKENIKLFESNILNPIESDPSIENVDWKTYSIDDDVEVLCIGDEQFMENTKALILDGIGGEINE